MISTYIPNPTENEGPVEYADRLGRWYVSSLKDESKRNGGQFFTPCEIARFMAQLYTTNNKIVHVLDPGAGAGVLTCALCVHLASLPQKPRKIIVEAYETDQMLANGLSKSLQFLQNYLNNFSVKFAFTICSDDFIIHNSEIFDGPQLFTNQRVVPNFDVAISNPPYFKISKSDPRAIAAKSVVYGQPNIYALFMAVSASLLKAGGELIFITPRSFTSGFYFKRFREYFFSKVKPKLIHVFESRKHAFSRDEVLQENVIFQAKRADNWPQKKRKSLLCLSSCQGLDDLCTSKRRKIDLAHSLNMNSEHKILRLPMTKHDENVLHEVDSWPGSLKKYGLEISTGPVVPFRSVNFLTKKGNAPKTHVPLLWMNHVQPMKIVWPKNLKNKAEYIVVSHDSKSLLVPNENYVLLRRFSAKEQDRRLTASPFLKSTFHTNYIGLENHINYIYRPGGSLKLCEAYGLAIIFNSSILDSYFRVNNGNTQVGAIEIKTMPLPDLEVIKEIGKKAQRLSLTIDNIDKLVGASLMGLCN
jgi:adenine-specific DNA-methyltransferase